ncbi:hypothetical protein ACQY0O_007370 [Thecaphora frezii]
MFSFGSALGQMKANTMHFLGPLASPSSSPPRAAAAAKSPTTSTPTSTPTSIPTSIPPDADASSSIPPSSSFSSSSSSLSSAIPLPYGDAIPTPSSLLAIRPSANSTPRASAQLSKLQQRLLYDSESDTSFDLSYSSPESEGSHSCDSDYSSQPTTETGSCTTSSRDLSESRSHRGHHKQHTHHLRSSIAVQRVLLSHQHHEPNASSSSSSRSSSRSSWRKSRGVKNNKGLAEPIQFPLPPGSAARGEDGEAKETQRLDWRLLDEDEDDDEDDDGDEGSQDEGKASKGTMKSFLTGFRQKPLALASASASTPEKGGGAGRQDLWKTKREIEYRAMDYDARKPVALHLDRNGTTTTGSYCDAGQKPTGRASLSSPRSSYPATLEATSPSLSPSPSPLPSPSPSPPRHAKVSWSSSSSTGSGSSHSGPSSVSSASSSPSKIRPLQTLRNRGQTGNRMQYRHTEDAALQHPKPVPATAARETCPKTVALPPHLEEERETLRASALTLLMDVKEMQDRIEAEVDGPTGEVIESLYKDSWRLLDQLYWASLES